MLLKDFYVKLGALIDDARKRDVKLISLAKDSSSSFLRDYCLYKMHREEARRLKALHLLEPKELETVETLLYRIFRTPVEAARTAKNLKARYGQILERLEMIAGEGLSKTTDLMILKGCSSSIGYTKPMLLGPSSRLLDLYKSAMVDIEEYTMGKLLLPSEMAEEVSEALESISSLPAVASSYVRFDVRDYPLRIDIPANSLGIDRRFFDVRIQEPLEEDSEFRKLLVILRSLYASKEVHNVWIHEADRRARFRRREASALLEILDKEIGPIELSRRGMPEPPE
ncbi:MAG: hypothetical protein NZ920_02660 [Aigarchaeota archaeon]|nr:hypothetical protein [Aigarchaeota archaeon]MDW8092474.1 hypothetical protein [Nitrososphaerota archaeon]